MHIWTDIVTRELVMLITLLALGSGPASFLGRRFDPAARVAMAPVLGLCAGTCVFTTLLWFTAASNTYWLLPILALVSLVVAATSGSEGDERPERQAASLPRSSVGSGAGSIRRHALAVVCVVVAAPLSYTLHERHSVGPTGIQSGTRTTTRQSPTPWCSSRSARLNKAAAFERELHAADVDGLLRAAFKTSTRRRFSQRRRAARPARHRHPEPVPDRLPDNGRAWRVCSGSLRAPNPCWVAPLAGVLFAGPFFLQLMADGSQAATCGLGTLLPIAVVGLDALRKPRTASLALLALLMSGLMALYPLFVPGVAFAGATILLVVGGKAWWRGELTRRVLLLTGARIGAVLALSALFNLLSFTRDVRYWRGVLNGAYYITGLPVYHLPYSVLPGWLLQTREFYFLSELGSTSAKQVLLGVSSPSC